MGNRVGAAVGLAAETQYKHKLSTAVSPKPGTLARWTWPRHWSALGILPLQWPACVATGPDPDPTAPAQGPTRLPGPDCVMTPVGCGWGTLWEETHSLQQPFSRQDRFLASSWKFQGQRVRCSLKGLPLHLVLWGPQCLHPSLLPRELPAGDVDRPLEEAGVSPL